VRVLPSEAVGARLVKVEQIRPVAGDVVATSSHTVGISRSTSTGVCTKVSCTCRLLSCLMLTAWPRATRAPELSPRQSPTMPRPSGASVTESSSDSKGDAPSSKLLTISCTLDHSASLAQREGKAMARASMRLSGERAGELKLDASLTASRPRRREATCRWAWCPRAARRSSRRCRGR
jgi:hypothetical protein